MQANPLDPLFYRTKGWEFIDRGKELFNSPQKPNDQKKGYLIFKKGLEFLIEYGKRERNEEVVMKLKSRLNEWFHEAKEMEAVVFPPNLDAIPHKSSTMHQNKSPHVDTTNTNPKSPVNLTRSKSKSFDHSVSPTTGKKRIVEGNDNYASKLMSNLEAVIITEKPNVKWDDIAGLETAKKSLQEAVIYPIKYPHLFEGMRTPWKGILLYGPSGTGKTFLAKACAGEADSTFFSVSAADLMSKYVGESEKLIKIMFKMARERKPAIIFIDEIDSLLASRSDSENEVAKRVKTQFLVEMQGVTNDDPGILVLGATNLPWVLDPAVRRRFEKRIYIPLPDLIARKALFEKQLSKTPTNLLPEDIEYLTTRTEGYSGADINILIRDACYEPLRNAQVATHFKVVDQLPDGKPVYQPCSPNDPQAQPMKMFDIPGPQIKLKGATLEDFEVALEKTKPSVGVTDMKKHQEFTEQFGIEG